MTNNQRVKIALCRALFSLKNRSSVVSRLSDNDMSLLADIRYWKNLTMRMPWPYVFTSNDYYGCMMNVLSRFKIPLNGLTEREIIELGREFFTNRLHKC